MAAVNLKPGMVIGHRYRVERLLDPTGTGRLFLCTDTRDRDMPVALRIIPVSGPDEKSLSSLRQRFSNLSRIRHPNLAHVLDLGMLEAEHKPFLVSEFVEGSNLFTVSEGWTEEKVVRAIVQLCRVIQHLHAEKIVHGDLKPSNVICPRAESDSEPIKVVNWGLRPETQEPQKRFDLSGLAYAAPEVLLGQQASVGSDLYSLGVLAYQLLTRRLPFEQDDQGYIVQKHLQGRADMRPVERLESGLGMSQVLQGLLEKEPARRPSSAAEVIRLLSAATGRDYSSGVRTSIEGYFSQGRFVGRDKEMAFLQERAARVLEKGRGWTIFVLGEAGSGKTRCMEEFRIWALLHGWRIVEGKCLPQDSLSYRPYRQILNATAPQRGEESSPSGQEEIFRFDEELGVAETPALELPADSAAGQYRDLLAREILRRLTNGPTLLFLHDFHWSDEATTTVLEYLTSDVLTHPILICVSLRPGEVGREQVGRLMEQGSRQVRAETLELSALSEASTEALVASMTGDDDLANRIGSWVHKSSGGNPFFAEEVLKHMVDCGLLRKGPEGWELKPESLEKLEVPAGVAVILRDRLGHLSQPARELAEWLAVFNRAVPTDLLRAAGSFNEAEMAAAVNELLSSQIVHLVSGESGECIEFRHVLIGEVIREGLPKAQTRRMHRRIGETIEESLGVERHYFELATHYVEGNCGEKAIQYALKAAAAYRAEFANRAALKLYEYILRHRGSLSIGQLCDVAIDAAEAYCSLGQAKRAVRVLRDIVDRKYLGIPKYLKARLLAQLASAHQHLDDINGLEATSKKGLFLLRKDTSLPSKHIRAQLLIRLGFSAFLRYRTRRTLMLGREALDLLPQHDNSALSARIYSLICGTQLIACNLKEAYRAGKRSVEILDSLGVRHLQASPYSQIGCALYALGRFQLAIKYHEEAVRLSEEVRSVLFRSQAVMNLAETLCRMGRVLEAAFFGEQAMTLSVEGGNASMRCAASVIQTEIRIHQGEYQTAIEHLERTGTDLKPIVAVYLKAESIFQSAWVAFELGNYDSALKHLRILKTSWVRAPIHDYELGEILKARVYFHSNQVSAALSLLIRLDKSLARKHWPYHRSMAKIRLAEVCIAIGNRVLGRKSARDALRLAKAMPSYSLEGYACYFLAKVDLIQAKDGSLANPRSGEREPYSRESLIVIRDQLSKALSLAESSRESELIWRAAADLARTEELLNNSDSSLSNSKKAVDCLDALEKQVPPKNLSSYRRLPERAHARWDCQERLRRLMLSRRERLQDLGAMEEKHLRILFRVSSLVNSIRELDPLLEAVADQLLQVTNAQRAHVFLCEESSKNLRPAKKKTAEDATGLELASIDRQFTNDVFQSGHPFMSADSSKDDRFQNYQQNNGPLPGTVFCAPLIAGGKTIGVLYADHPSPREKLDESAINLFAAFCNLAAVAIDNALAHQTLLREKAELQQHLLQASEKYPEIVGRSATMSRLRERIALVASSPLDVLIVGESGTGKELVARALHRTGRRATGIFVPLDCGAFSDTLIESELFGYRKGAFTGAGENRPGLLETANGGVIFLDEISSLSLKLQGKILRVLQEREVRRIGETATRKIDVQIIAATNRNLMDEIRKGRFRRDLYYRLNAIQIQLLPLREHMEDVPLLLEWFLHRISQVENGKAKSFSPEAFKFLCNYRFPGNVRELGNIVQNAYYSCPGAVIQTEHLPSEIREDLMEPMPFETKETARSIYEKLRAGRGKFDELVRKPFLSRSFGKDIVREVLRQALLEAEGRYRDAFRLLRISANQYSSMMIFFKRHDCYLDFRLFRQGSAAGTTGTE